jgi:hypothetical protein
MRFVLHRREVSLRGKYRLMGGNPFGKSSAFVLERESIPRMLEPHLRSHNALIRDGIAWC